MVLVAGHETEILNFVRQAKSVSLNSRPLHFDNALNISIFLLLPIF